jgi:hypothetical protein
MRFRVFYRMYCRVVKQMSTDVSEVRAASIFGLMMEAAGISETSNDICLITRQYIPEDSELHACKCSSCTNHPTRRRKDKYDLRTKKHARNELAFHLSVQWLPLLFAMCLRPWIEQFAKKSSSASPVMMTTFAVVCCTVCVDMLLACCR